jgi:Mrp family chromosome partitioning ATPase
LWAITTGRLPPNPAELVGSERMSAILEKIKRHVDLVVLDTPPLMAVTDAAVLAPRVDGVLLVIKPGATRLSACRHSVEQLRRAGANILGVVLNDVNMRSARYRYSYYRSYYNSYYKKYGSSTASPPGPSTSATKAGSTWGFPRWPATPASIKWSALTATIAWATFTIQTQANSELEA